MPDATPSLPSDHDRQPPPAGQYRPPQRPDEGAEPRAPHPTPSDANIALDHLLAEIHVRLRQGRYDEVQERLAKAKALAPEHPAVLEIEGDLAFAQRRYKQAETLYKAAFDADRSNRRVEEKFATALLKVHAPDYASIHQIPDDAESLWSNRVARPPLASAILSALMPGLGQFYNGDWLKGAALLVIDLVILSRIAYLLYAALSKLNSEGGAPMATVMAHVYQNLSIPMILLMTAAWVYSITDAVMTARSLQK